MTRGSGMSPTRRRNRRPKADCPEALAARLPDELRSLDGIDTPGDLGQRLTALGSFAGSDALALPVFNAAGHSVAGWYRQALMKEN